MKFRFIAMLVAMWPGKKVLLKRTGDTLLTTIPHVDKKLDFLAVYKDGHKLETE